MSSADVSAESAVAGSSASTNPSTTSPKEETVTPSPEAASAAAGSSDSTKAVPTAGKEVKAQAESGKEKVTSPQTDPPATEKKKGTRPEHFNPVPLLKRAAEVVERAGGLETPVILADVNEVEARAKALQQVAAHLVAARLQVPTAAASLAQHDDPLDVALSLMRTALRKHGTQGATIYRESCRRGDLYAKASTLLARIREAKTAVSPGLVQGLEDATTAAEPKAMARDAARADLDQVKASYATAREELSRAMRVLRSSISAHRAEAKRLALAPMPLPTGKGGRRSR